MTTAQKWSASLYSEKHSFVWKLAGDLLQLLSAQPGERILDLGCGTGQLTAEIAALGAEVIGVDSSTEMIREARDKHPELRFEIADARELKLEETFDAVFSNATLHWILEPERVIVGIRKVLKPGGRFVAEFGGKGNLKHLVEAFRRAAGSLGIALNKTANLWYFPGVGEYSQLLELQGFEVSYAVLFDRPTPLDDGERGLGVWMEMFGGPLLAQIPEEKRESFLRDVEREAKSALFHDGQWVLDYRRLRIVAHTTGP